MELKSRMKILITSLLMIFTVGCSTLSRQEFHRSYDLSFSTPIANSASVKVSVGSRSSGQDTRLMTAGDVYVSVPTGNSGPSYSDTDKRNFGKRLTNLLVEINAFKQTDYIATPDYVLSSSKVASQPTVLIVRLNDVYMGGDGWPTDIDATVTLKKDGKVLFEKSYTSSSGLLGIGGCFDCYPQDIAEKKLTKAFLNDLLNWHER